MFRYTKKPRNLQPQPFPQRAQESIRLLQKPVSEYEASTLFQTKQDINGVLSPVIQAGKNARAAGQNNLLARQQTN